MSRGKNHGKLVECGSTIASARSMVAGWTALLALFVTFGDVMAFSRSDIVLSASSIAQGDSGWIEVKTKQGTEPKVHWMGGSISLVSDPGKKAWYGFFGVDLKAEPGLAPLDVEPRPAGEKYQLKVRIVKKDRGVRVLTLPREMVELDAKTVERVKAESRVMNEVLEVPSGPPLWRGPFVRPLEGEVIGAFGTRSVINGEPRSPHSGVDLRAKEGTPVHSIHNGKVVLIADHFFSGKSMVIDHGGAIQSMYFHLEKTMVEKGEEVKKGEVIGLAGSTGRATGPHLHFGMRVNGARVDPLQFMVLSEQIGRP
jgi:hypothetical protein